METSENINLIAGALTKAQSELRGAKQDSENPFYRSKYADLTSVWEACRKPLTDNGLSVVQTTSIGIQGECIINTMLLHNSGQWIRGNLQMPAESDPQKLGKLITYGRRYGLAAIVGVSPEDDDAESISTDKRKAEPQKKETPAKTQTEPKSENKELDELRVKIFNNSQKMGYTAKQMTDLIAIKFGPGVTTKDLNKKQCQDLIAAIEKGEGL